jgi:hypothetical protein
MKDNRHAQAIPQEILTQAQTKINEVKTLLAPYICSPDPFGTARTAENG